ncbi:MAG: hypothetical protein INQ03_19645 [Candidatus Heimdallarchaeota archaeon]|nr:hypothetical protein [Candidatus Heimdallarchaeota archaeon]
MDPITIIIGGSIGLLNFVFTIFRTKKIGPKLILSEPFEVVLRREDNRTVKGLLINTGDISTVITKVASTGNISVIDIERNQAIHGDFVLKPGSFIQLQVTQKNTGQGIIFVNYTRANGKLRELELHMNY